MTSSQTYHLPGIDRHDLFAGSRIRVLCLIFFFAAIVCTYLQWVPHAYHSFKDEDSGLFLHIGQRLNQGDVLYRDIADNKPPLIYWLNKFGLLLTHGSPGGVLFLCVASGLLTYAVLFWGLQELVGWQLFIIAGAWAQLAFLACVVHPNYTESFALPLETLAGVLFVRELLASEGELLSSQQVNWYPLAQGATAALLFSLRANNIAISIIYCIYLLSTWRKGNRIVQLGLFAVAAAATFGLVLLPLALQGVLPDYVTNVFRLAGPYTSGTTAASRVRALWHGLSIIGVSPLFYLSLACGATVILVRREDRRTRIVIWLAVWLVLEMVMSSTSGYHWSHYFLLWIPPLVLTMLLAGSILFPGSSNSLLPVFLAASLILVLLNQSLLQTYLAWSFPRPEDAAVALARTYSKPGDRITTWGHFHHELWFDINHKPGTRWFHEGAFTNRKIYQALLPAFLSDLEKNRPAVVIERRSAVPLFAPANPKEPLNDAFPAEYFQGWDTPEIVSQKAALAQHYTAAADKSGITVYVRRD